MTFLVFTLFKDILITYAKNCYDRKRGKNVVNLKVCVSFLEAAVHFFDLLLAEPKERGMQQQSLKVV
jgi:hypothetical protein